MSEKKFDRMRALRPLATRDYRLLFAALGIEVSGTGMWTIVMVVQVLALDDSPLALSAVAIGMSLGSGVHRRRHGYGGRSIAHRNDRAVGRRRRLVCDGRRKRVLLPGVQCVLAKGASGRTAPCCEWTRGRTTPIDGPRARPRSRRNRRRSFLPCHRGGNRRGLVLSCIRHHPVPQPPRRTSSRHIARGAHEHLGETSVRASVTCRARAGCSGR